MSLLLDRAVIVFALIFGVTQHRRVETADVGDLLQSKNSPHILAQNQLGFVLILKRIQISPIFKPGRKEGLIGTKEDAFGPQQIDDAADSARLDAAAAKLEVDVRQIENLLRPCDIIAMRLDDHEFGVA